MPVTNPVASGSLVQERAVTAQIGEMLLLLTILLSAALSQLIEETRSLR